MYNLVFQTKYNFSKEEIYDLYINQKLSLNQIAEIFGCSSSTILRILINFKIERRPAYFKKFNIPKEDLYDLYCNKKLNSNKIGKLYGIDGRVIRKKLKKFNISTRSISEACNKKVKYSFSGDLKERAYLLGLRTGDFQAKRKNFTIRLQTSTTHPALIELTKLAFNRYGEAKICYTPINKEWFVYSDLNTTFKFLLEKPKEIPIWILENYIYFFNFLAGYMDSEGSWCVKQSHLNFVRFLFEIKSCDYLVLKQIKEKLNNLNYSCWLYLSVEKGTETPKGILNEDLYHLVVYRKEDVISLIKNLLQFSKHPEKIQKMNFILENKDNNKWVNICSEWKEIIKDIKLTILK